MAAVIRLRRTGGKKKPSAQIIVCDSRLPRDGRFIEKLGVYNQTKATPVINLKKERCRYWLKVGAKPSVTVRSIFKKEGVI